MEYRIDFYCNEDLRDFHVIEATDEVRALILALARVNMQQDSWVDGGSAVLGEETRRKYWIKITA